MEKTAHKHSNYASIVLFEAAQNESNVVTYFDELGNKKTVTDRVMKVEKGETDILILENGQRINLELVYSVDFDISPYYADDYFKCDCV